MTNDIMRTINAGGTVMFPERAVKVAGEMVGGINNVMDKACKITYP